MSFFIVGRKFFGHQRNFLVLHGDAQGGLEDFTFDPRSATHFDSREEAEAVVSALMLRPDRVDGQGYEVIERRPKLSAPHQEQHLPKGQGPEVLPVLQEVLERKWSPRTSEGRRWGALIEDLRARIAKGVETYGEPLRAKNGRDPIRDAREEGLDQLLYLTQGYMEGRMPRAHWLWLVGQVATALLDSEPEALERRLVEREWALQRAEEELDMAGRALDELRASARAIPAAEWRDAWGRLADAQEEARRAREEVAGFFAGEDQNVREEG